GKRKMRAYSGHLSKEELSELGRIANVEIIGSYIINTRDDDFRLNFDMVSLLRDKINKTIVEIDEKQLDLWMRGHDLDVKGVERGIVVVKFDGELVGVGKSNTEKIFNYVPKERKLKTALPNEK
ncbi:MAG: hypothetical protein KC506_04055, partial [Nanoarchaeota archaeon]|nr:hypothetical protein [Nanoarchaeota archaeon]